MAALSTSTALQMPLFILSASPTRTRKLRIDSVSFCRPAICKRFPLLRLTLCESHRAYQVVLVYSSCPPTTFSSHQKTQRPRPRQGPLPLHWSLDRDSTGTWTGGDWDARPTHLRQAPRTTMHRLMHRLLLEGAGRRPCTTGFVSCCAAQSHCTTYSVARYE